MKQKQPAKLLLFKEIATIEKWLVTGCVAGILALVDRLLHKIAEGSMETATDSTTEEEGEGKWRLQNILTPRSSFLQNGDSYER
jgi:hypothetical protein